MSGLALFHGELHDQAVSDTYNLLATKKKLTAKFKCVQCAVHSSQGLLLATSTDTLKYRVSSFRYGLLSSSE